MRITFISSGAVPSRAAHSVQIMRMCDAYGGLGHEVTLVTPRPPRSRRRADHGAGHDANAAAIHAYYGTTHPFRIERLANTDAVPGGGYLYAWRAVRRARSVGCDLVHARNLKAAFLAARAGLSVVLELHRLDQLDHRDQAALLRRLVRHRGLQRLVVISQALADDLVQLVPGVRDRIVVAHDSAVEPDLTAPPVVLAGAHAQLEVGYVGSLHPGKGLDLIVELARSVPWSRFHVVGGDDTQVHAVRSDPALPGNVVLHGHVPPSQTTAWLRAFDVLLAPYGHHVEGAQGTANLVRWMSPLKLFEYMSVGRPIVTTDLPVLREVLTHDRDALLCPAGDVVAWSAALTRLRDEPGLRSALGEAAQERFARAHTYSQRARAILDAVAS